MGSEGTDLIKTLYKLEGFTRSEAGGVTTLTNMKTGEQYRISTTSNNRFVVSQVGTQNAVSFNGAFGSGQLLTNIQCKLANMGLEVRGDRIQRAAKAARIAEAAETADSPTITDTPSNPTDHPAPEVGAMTAAVEDLFRDLPTTIDIIREEVERLAKADKSPRVVERGQAYLDWQGDIWTVLQSIWDDLPELDKLPSEDLARIKTELIPQMRRSRHALREQQLARKNGKSVWRVREDGPSDVVKATPPSTPAVPIQTAIPAATPPPVKEAPAAVDILPEPATADVISAPTEDEKTPVKLYKCEKCAFADVSPEAVQRHKNKFKSREDKHPTDHPGIPCPVPACWAVRTSVEGHKKHLVESHQELYGNGQVMCHKTDCLRWFDTMSGYRVHLRDEHPEGLRRRKNEVAVVPATPAVVATAPKPKVSVNVGSKFVAVPAEMAPTVGNGTYVGEETPAQAAFRMMTEYPALKERVEVLEARNAVLEAEVREKDKAMRGFKKKLDALFD